MARKAPEGTQWCRNCKQFRPAGEFYRISKPGWRVVGCSPCVRAKMARWQRYVEMDPGKVSGID